MTSCENIRAQMMFYLDDELHERDRAELELHLADCGECRTLFESERDFLQALTAAQPLYPAPSELRTRIQETLKDLPVPHTASRALRKRIERTLRQAGLVPVGEGRRILAVATVLIFVLLLGVWAATEYMKRVHRGPSAFALIAVATHLRHLGGQLPLEISTAAPDQIRGWFNGKVPFGLALPNYQEASGQEKLYEIEGARLVAYESEYAAYVSYRMQKRPISLLVTSERTAQPSGGEEIVSKGITFHCDSISGYKVITWSDSGLTYALVSDLEERGQQSCIVCHQGTKDQDFIEGLKP
jgi:mycothiol system anti-sigma-R factor